MRHAAMRDNNARVLKKKQVAAVLTAKGRIAQDIPYTLQ